MDWLEYLSCTVLGWEEDKFIHSTPRRIVSQIKMHIKYTNPKQSSNQTSSSTSSNQTKDNNKKVEKFSYGKVE